MKRLACILLMAVSVSGCSLAGVARYQVPAGAGGWSLREPKDKKYPNAEFVCSTYTYRVPRSIVVSASYWFGPPLIPFIPKFFGRQLERGEREFELVMEGNHADTLPCPILTLEEKDYKAWGVPDKDRKECRYTIATPQAALQAGLTLSIVDQMGCKVTPLNLKPISEYFYLPVIPPGVLFL